MTPDNVRAREPFTPSLSAYFFQPEYAVSPGMPAAPRYAAQDRWESLVILRRDVRLEEGRTA